jgi:hypothetical protein
MMTRAPQPARRARLTCHDSAAASRKNLAMDDDSYPEGASP